MINVLDHGFVRLVSYTQPANREYEIGFDDELDDYVVVNDGWSGDLEIVRNARVSYDADWRTGDDAGKDEKLITYLYDNKHTSPFEAMSFTFEVKAPIFVIRQWHRHRTWKYNEVSARYTELPEEFFVPDVLLKQGTGNKQMSGEPFSTADSEAIKDTMHAANTMAFDLYKDLLRQGVSREIARTVLPLATYTRMFASVDLHNLFHFIRLRTHSHAQPEIRVYAEALLRLVEPIVPNAVRAFNG